MKLKPETKNNIKKTIEITLGIPYEEFELLDSDEQTRLITTHKKNQIRKSSDEVTVLIGSGENSIFTEVKKGEIVLVGSGEGSYFDRAGISPEEARKELDSKKEDDVYSKPVAFVKKLQRRIKKQN